jgi:excisionase family DNA binding protein
MRKFLKVSEVSETLGASRRTVLRWIYEGNLRAVKLGGGRIWRIRERDLQRFIRAEERKEGMSPLSNLI